MPCQTTSVSSRPRIFGFWRERSIPPLACPGTPLYGGLWATLRASKTFFRLKTACKPRFAGVPGQLRLNHAARKLRRWGPLARDLTDPRVWVAGGHRTELSAHLKATRDTES